MSDGRAEARLIAGPRGMQVTKSANKDGNALKKYLDGSRRLEPCERRGRGEYSRLGGSSPLRPLLTAWCGCGTAFLRVQPPGKAAAGKIACPTLSSPLSRVA